MTTVPTITTATDARPTFSLDKAVEIISPVVLAEGRADVAYAEFARTLGSACEAAYGWKIGGTGRETKTLALRLPLVMTKKNGEVRHADTKKCETLAIKANVKTTDRWIVIGSVLSIVSDKGAVEAKEGDLFPAITIGKVVNQLLNREVGFPAMLAAVKAVNKDESPSQAKALAALRKLGVKAPAVKAEKDDADSTDETTDDESTVESLTPEDTFTMSVDAAIAALDAVALLTVEGAEWQATDLARLNERISALIKA